MTQRELSVFLRAIVVGVGVCCLAIGVYGLLVDGREFVWLTVFYGVTLVPMYAALVLFWRIFADIGRDRSFTQKNALRLRGVSRLALLDTLLYVAGLVVVFLRGPNVLLLFITVILLGIAMTVLCAALSHLTQKAYELKSENDLTI